MLIVNLGSIAAVYPAKGKRPKQNQGAFCRRSLWGFVRSLWRVLKMASHHASNEAMICERLYFFNPRCVDDL